MERILICLHLEPENLLNTVLFSFGTTYGTYSQLLTFRTRKIITFWGFFNFSSHHEPKPATSIWKKQA